MSNTTPPPEFPPPIPSEPPTPAKKSRTNLVIIGAAVAVVAAVVATGVVVVQSRDDCNKPASVAKSCAPTVASAATEASTPTPTHDEVTADSFTIKLKTTSRQCFGSAGCNLTVEPNLTYQGDSGSIDPNAVYEITYEIHGDESGPVIATAELSDRTSLNYTPSSISTASASTTVSVKITDVTKQSG
ncbi:hypothetical protein ABT187_45335 [Streptomyces sp. NPDC001817]|uniref:hypothetical protein n=1 Tax=Streptomyces sp. NPDC001817 TaxID=3154398 RepID=UPI003330A1F0